MKNFPILGALALFIGTVACAGELDGTTWKVAVTPSTKAAKAGETPFEEILIFAADKLLGKTWVLRGYQAQLYTTIAAEGSMQFRSEQKNLSGEGTATWTGKIKDGTVEGTLRWVRPDGRLRLYSFKGAKQ